MLLHDDAVRQNLIRKGIVTFDQPFTSYGFCGNYDCSTGQSAKTEAEYIFGNCSFLMFYNCTGSLFRINFN